MKTKSFGPFFPYSPNDKRVDDAVKAGAIFLSDEKNNDWYDVQKSFSEDTLKITYCEKGVIFSASYDATTLFPQTLYVAEVEKKNIPDDFNLSLNGVWQFDGKSIIPRVYTSDEYKQQSINKKQQLMADAEAVIAPLSRAVKFDIATEEETRKLEAWERYSVLLSRVEISDDAITDWPMKPE